jgi:hypothetical protein
MSSSGNDLPRAPHIPIEPRERVKYVYHRIVCSYPRFGRDAPHNSPGIGGVRIPKSPEYSYQKGSVWYIKSQAAREYGLNTVRLCNAYGVEVLTGWWDKYDFQPWEHFSSSVRQVPDLGNLRLAYMFGVLRYEKPDRGFPDTVEDIVAKVREWAPEMANRARYAYITDYQGNSRPMLFCWGAILNETGAGAFQTMVGRIREIIKGRTGATPFIVLSQHNALGPRFEKVTSSVDAFYQHEIAIPDKRNAPAQYHSISTQQSLDGIMTPAYTLPGTRVMISDAIRYLAGKKSAATGQPVHFIAGCMPQFNSDLVADNYHGVVRAGSKAEVQRMFEMVRDLAPTIWTAGTAAALVEHKWVAVSTLAEWAEGTSIEPTIVRPGGAPGGAYNQYGDYGSDFMDLLLNVFRETPWMRR